jgi:hypothetical protein
MPNLHTFEGLALVSLAGRGHELVNFKMTEILGIFVV